MSNRFRRMPATPEVDTLQAQVSSDQGFMPDGNSQNGAVVANAFEHTWSGPRLAANACDQSFFSEWQESLVEQPPYLCEELKSPAYCSVGLLAMSGRPPML